VALVRVVSESTWERFLGTSNPVCFLVAYPPLGHTVDRLDKVLQTSGSHLSTHV